jgi:hypothetical protein
LQKGALLAAKDQRNQPTAPRALIAPTTLNNLYSRVGRCFTISPRLKKTTHHRVTDNEKFRLQNYHNPSGFQSYPLQPSGSTLEPTGFDYDGPQQAGLSSGVV